MGTLELAANCIHVYLSELVCRGVHMGSRGAGGNSDINSKEGGRGGGVLGLCCGF